MLRLTPAKRCSSGLTLKSLLLALPKPRPKPIRRRSRVNEAVVPARPRSLPPGGGNPDPVFRVRPGAETGLDHRHRIDRSDWLAGLPEARRETMTRWLLAHPQTLLWAGIVFYAIGLSLVLR